MNSIERRVITPVWEWVDRPELQAATVAFAENGISMTGVVVTQLNEEPLRLRYALSLNPAWQMQEANLEIESRQDASKLNMLCLPMGWQVNGQMREDRASCVDIDIMGSPSINTLPIQQLRWQTGLTQDFWMAYIRLPDLVVLPVAQRYTDLGDAGDHDRRSVRSHTQWQARRAAGLHPVLVPRRPDRQRAILLRPFCAVCSIRRFNGCCTTQGFWRDVDHDGRCVT